jgi:hypothetical protein
MDLEDINHTDILPTAYDRGRLRLEQCGIDDTVKTEEIHGYEGCLEGYAELERQRQTAHDDLAALMATPEHMEQQSKGVLQRTAWRYGEQKTADGRQLPVLVS